MRLQIPLPIRGALMALLLTATTAHADTLYVTNTADNGAGSLRNTLAAAQPGDTILFRVPLPATITLTGEALSVDKDLTISGPGASQLTIARDPGIPGFAIFLVGDVHATISGMTMTGGRGTTDNDSSGGAVIDNGDLTLDRVVITASQAALGGGVYVGGTRLLVTDSYLYGNAAIWGGGIYQCCNAAVVTVERSTITANTAVELGSAVAISGGYYLSSTFHAVNATIDGELEVDYGAPASYTIDSSTLTSDGAVFPDRWATGSTVTVRNSILRPAPGQPIGNASGTTVSQGYNVFTGQVSGALLATDHIGVDPQLAALADNGGPVPTRALLSGSIAIDAGTCTDSTGAAIATDERGTARPQGGQCDIGAFEFATTPDQTTQAILSKLDVVASSRASQDSVDTLNGATTAIKSSVDKLPAAVTQIVQTSMGPIGTDVEKVLAIVQALSLSDSTAVIGDVKARLSAIDTTTTGISAAIDDAERARMRIAIERALGDGAMIVWFMVPQTSGGQLELVQQTVDADFAALQSAHIRISNKALKYRDDARAAYFAGSYAAAYGSYVKAYQELIGTRDR